jgi:large subunit ribosomal protein L6
MSRIGKLPVQIPEKVELEIVEEGGDRVVVCKGPNGELRYILPEVVKVEIGEGQLVINVEDSGDDVQRAMWGTARAVIQNMVTGVIQGFKVELELSGVGYRMELKGEQLVLYIGLSHPVTIDVPEEVSVQIDKSRLIATSKDKQKVGAFMGRIHGLKPLDPYKQKGFRYPGRTYPVKEVKKK